METSISYFERFNKNAQSVALSYVLNRIKSDQALRGQIEECRKWYGVDNTQYAYLKKQLPAVTFSATFDPTRKLDNLESYTGIVCVDYDKLTSYQVRQGASFLRGVKCVLSCFISPSGQGLKVLIATSNNDIKDHKHSVQQCWKYLQNSGVKTEPDKCTTDIARLCFLSSDCHVYYNPNALELPIRKVIKQLHVVAPPSNTRNQRDSLDSVEAFTRNIIRFEEGQRNNFIFWLSINAKKQGFSISDVENHCRKYQESDFGLVEIAQTIKSVYKY